MKKHGYLALVIFVMLLATSAFAAPSAKFSAHVSNVTLISLTAEDGLNKEILSTTIKTPNKKDLLIGVSLDTGLYTNTLVRDKFTGAADTTSATSNAVAGVSIEVLLDGKPVAPSPVIFDQRDQKLSAKLAGILNNCTDLDGDGLITLAECNNNCTDVNGDGQIIADECLNCTDLNADGIITFDECLINEEIQLILNTMGAHHFNFVAANVTPGVHIVTVKATITTLVDNVNANAMALVGKGTLTVEEVRATNKPDGIEFLE